jgi:hypothetical protein
MSTATARDLALAERLVRSFSPDHPAKERLVRHALCLKHCAGREIPWPNQIPIDQEWFSQTEQRKLNFSGLIYISICYNPYYRGWSETTTPHEFSEEDRGFIQQLPRLVAIIDECKAAAEQVQNDKILNLLPYVDAYLEATCRCIMSIVEQRLIPVSEKPQIPFVNQVLNLP